MEPPRSTLGDRLRWDRWFVVIGLVAGLAFVFIIEPLAGVDEPSHTERLDTIAHGWLVPPPSDEDPASYTLDGCLSVREVFPPEGSYFDRFHNTPCGQDGPARTLGAIRASESYPPVPYVPAWLGYRIGRGVAGTVGSLYGARITQLLFYLVVTAFAIRIIPRGKPLLFAVALLPVVVMNASTISADPATNAFAFLSLALILRLVARGRTDRPTDPVTTWEILGVGLALVLLGLCKPGYVPLAVMVVAVPTVVFGTLRRRLVSVGAILGVVALTSAAWTLGVASRLDAPTRPNTDPSAQAEWIKDHPLGFLGALARTLTDSSEVRTIVEGLVVPVSRLPGRPGIAFWLLALTLVGLEAAWLADARPDLSGPPRADGERVDLRVVALALAVTAAFFVVSGYALMTYSTPVAARTVQGLQGRYFLPLIPLCLFGAPFRERRPAAWWTTAWIPLFSAGLLVWWALVLAI